MSRLKSTSAFAAPAPNAIREDITSAATTIGSPRKKRLNVCIQPRPTGHLILNTITKTRGLAPGNFVLFDDSGKGLVQGKDGVANRLTTDGHGFLQEQTERTEEDTIEPERGHSCPQQLQ